MRKLALAPLALTLTLALASGGAQAADVPQPGMTDSRIQTVDYDPEQVILLLGALNYQFMLEFGGDERIENVSIGDAIGWQVTPNKAANRLFIKPVDPKSGTNMTVVTTSRRYVFDLRIASRAQRDAVPYVVRFRYPQVAVALPEPDPEPQPLNEAYTVAGSAENRPLRIFDDGRMTYFQWAEGAAQPAIFAVGPKGEESLVNVGVRQGYTVVEQLSPRFVLRNGKEVATVTNNGFAGPTAGGS